MNGSLPADAVMDRTAAELLATHRIMAVSTIRPDGWPQTTFVGYANDGPDLYFIIFRGSQKFANIAAEPRISIAIGDEPPDMRLARALYAGARASEIKDPRGREEAWKLLKRRHENLVGTPIPDAGNAAIMMARCEHVSVVDYTKGLGHTEEFDVAIRGDRPDVGGR